MAKRRAQRGAARRVTTPAEVNAEVAAPLFAPRAWLARDRAALGSYDIIPALQSPEGSWEYALGKLALTSQSGRAHLALVYSHDMGNAIEPARVAVQMLEDIVAKCGGDKVLGIVGRPGVPSFTASANIWKDLGIGYEILSHADERYVPRIALAYEKFVTNASANDADLPVARQYLEQHRPQARP